MNGTEQFSTRWRQVKSCARCHRLKIRCTFEDPTFKSCSKCFAIGVNCSPDIDPTAKFARKKTRKTKGVEQEVEKRLIYDVNSVKSIYELIDLTKRSISDMIENKEPEIFIKENLENLSSELSEISSKVNNLIEGYEDDGINSNGYERFNQLNDLNYPHIDINSNLAKELLFKLKLISLEESQKRFDYFHNDILPFYPMLLFSEELSNFDYLLEHSPIILLCCIYVTTVNNNDLSDTENHDDHKKLNRSLNKLLGFYLENFLAYHVYIKSQDFNYHLIYAALILSFWCLPSHKNGHFKSQINLLTAFNISLCINTGNLSNKKMNKILFDDSHDRNDLRVFLSVYCSCGSLGLSLPRYKLVTWSKNYSNAVSILLKRDQVNDLPKRYDRYLCYYAKLIYLGQEMLSFLSLNNSHIPLDSYKNDNLPDPMIHKVWDDNTVSMSNTRIILNNYEQKLYQILMDSGFMINSKQEESLDAPKERYLLSIVYYHILVIVYDNLISSYLYSRKSAFMQAEQTAFLADADYLIYLQHIAKLIKACENILKTFIKINLETINFPTFIYYRAMHALILLVRLQLLIKSHSSLLTEDRRDLEINVEYYFEEVSKIISKGQSEKDLVSCLKMSFILSKINNWLKLSTNFRSQNNYVPQTLKSGKTDANANFIKLTDMSKDQEIENLEPPRPELENLDDHTHKKRKMDTTLTEGNGISNVNGSKMNDSKYDLQNDDIKYENSAITPVENLAKSLNFDSSDMYSNTHGPSIHEIFKEIDTDIIGYLNSLESNLNFNETIGNMDFNFPTSFSNSNDDPNMNPMYNLFSASGNEPSYQNDFKE